MRGVRRTATREGARPSQEGARPLEPEAERACVFPPQLWRLHREDMEPQREQQRRLHAARAQALYTGRGARRPQQQRRDLAGLERKRAPPVNPACRLGPWGARPVAAVLGCSRGRVRSFPMIPRLRDESGVVGGQPALLGRGDVQPRKGGVAPGCVACVRTRDAALHNSFQLSVSLSVLLLYVLSLHHTLSSACTRIFRSSLKSQRRILTCH